MPVPQFLGLLLEPHALRVALGFDSPAGISTLEIWMGSVTVPITVPMDTSSGNRLSSTYTFVVTIHLSSGEQNYCPG